MRVASRLPLPLPLALNASALLAVFFVTRVYLALANHWGSPLVAPASLAKILLAGIVEDAIVVLFLSLLLLISWRLFAKRLAADGTLRLVVFTFFWALQLSVLLVYFIDVCYYAFAKVHLHLYVLQYVRDAKYFFTSIVELLSPSLLLFFVL